jgi:dGTPase
VDRKYAGLNDKQRRKAVVHTLINRQVDSLVSHCRNRLEAQAGRTRKDLLAEGFRIGLHPELEEQRRQLEAFLYDRVYRHPQLVQVRREAQARLAEMFRALCANTDRVPEKFRRRFERVGRERAVVEFLAGMTDHYCDYFYRQVLHLGG